MTTYRANNTDASGADHDSAINAVAWMDGGRLVVDASAIAALLFASRIQVEPEWYSSSTYPHGARAFRRHIHQGMPAIRVGRGYRVTAADAASYWATLSSKKISRPRAAKPRDTVAEQLARAGIHLAVRTAPGGRQQ